MSRKPLAMSRIRQVLGLYQNNRTIREIARITGISRNSVRKYIREYGECEDVTAIDDTALGSIVHPAEAGAFNSARHVALVEHFGKEKSPLVKRRGNKQVIWEEYRLAHPDGYSYSQYCLLWRQYLKGMDISLPRHYGPGEVIEIDFAGSKLGYVDSETGEVVDCEIFLGVMVFSGLVFCRAVLTQQFPEVAACIGRMLAAFGGVPTGYIICDNMATLVKKAGREEPVLTDACEQMAEHYGTCFSPTRPYEPTDKPYIERSVSIAYDRIYTPLRHRTFHSLSELNAAITAQVEKLNARPFRKSPLSRMQLFTEHEQPLLRPMPASLFTPRLLRMGTVGKNNHVYIIHETSKVMYHYSVPWQYIGQRVRIYYDRDTVEVYLDDLTRQRIAVHRREGTAIYTTAGEHVPPSHRAIVAQRGWTNDYFYRIADAIGPCTRLAIERIIARYPNRTQAYRTCIALVKLNQKDGFSGRLEAACRRLEYVEKPSLNMVKNILAKGLDRAPADLFSEQGDKPVQPPHGNIRGKDAYR